MTQVYAVKDLDSGLFISEVAGCIFARRKYENYVYDKKRANQVMQDAKGQSRDIDYRFSHKHLAVVPVEIYSVPIVKRSIDITWSNKVKQGMPFETAIKGCALEHVRLFGSFIKKDKEISSHNFHFATSQF